MIGRTATVLVGRRYASTDILYPNIANPKRSARRGQNLSNRYRRLERSIKGKETLLKEIEIFHDKPVASSSAIQVTTAVSKTPKVFKGLVVPDPPRPPESDGLYCLPLDA